MGSVLQEGLPLSDTHVGGADVADKQDVAAVYISKCTHAATHSPLHTHRA